MSTCVKEAWSVLEDSLNNVYSIIEEQPLFRVNTEVFDKIIILNPWTRWKNNSWTLKKTEQPPGCFVVWNGMESDMEFLTEEMWLG